MFTTDEYNSTPKCRCIKALDWKQLSHKLTIWFNENEDVEILQAIEFKVCNKNYHYALIIYVPSDEELEFIESPQIKVDYND